MSFIDKNNILEGVLNGDIIEIELGCGESKRLSSSVGIDMLDYACVDMVGDVFDVLASLPDNSVKAVYSFHFIEHLSDLDRLMGELGRVLISGGRLDFVAPHFSNPYFYSDPTHSTFFGLYTFCYFCDENIFQRKVPSYQKELEYTLSDVQLVFRAARPFYFRYGLKKLIGSVFNLNFYLMELYEESFCYLFPCYEVRYLMFRK